MSFGAKSNSIVRTENLNFRFPNAKHAASKYSAVLIQKIQSSEPCLGLSSCLVSSSVRDSILSWFIGNAPIEKIESIKILPLAAYPT